MCVEKILMKIQKHTKVYYKNTEVCESILEYTEKYNTCQHKLGSLFSSICCVSGDGSSSYLSNAKLSNSLGLILVALNHITG